MPPQLCPHRPSPPPAFTAYSAYSATNKHVKEYPESCSSSPLMAVLSGACLFMSVLMHWAASSCHACAAGEGTPAALIHVRLLVTGERYTTLLSDSPAGCYDSQSSCQSTLCCKWIWWRQVYGTLHSLLACAWVTVFTAHKWSAVHIFWDIRRTVRRHTQR